MPLAATVADIDVRPGDLRALDPAASLALDGYDAANDLTGGDGGTATTS